MCKDKLVSPIPGQEDLEIQNLFFTRVNSAASSIYISELIFWAVRVYHIQC